MWPNLAKIAFDLLAIPTISSEYERVFSSVAKLIIVESSRLSLIMASGVLKELVTEGVN